MNYRCFLRKNEFIAKTSGPENDDGIKKYRKLNIGIVLSHLFSLDSLPMIKGIENYNTWGFTV
jgi:hypothetical protein